MTAVLSNGYIGKRKYHVPQVVKGLKGESNDVKLMRNENWINQRRRRKRRGLSSDMLVRWNSSFKRLKHRVLCMNVLHDVLSSGVNPQSQYLFPDE